VKHYDVFVTKFDSTGKLIWSTCSAARATTGLTPLKWMRRVCVHRGQGRSRVPRHAGAAQTTFQGGAVRFTARKTASCASCAQTVVHLVYCTYFGTTDYNIVRDIDIDQNGAVYIASSTTVEFPRAIPISRAPTSPQEARSRLRRGEAECLG
jgi:hypothetical protein